MLISYKWLQTYFKDPLPEPQALADLLTMKIFEVESLEEKKGDHILDVKVLPDRNPYCLSHRYIAQEIGALIQAPAIMPEISNVSLSPVSRHLTISVEDPVLCRRYMGRVVEGVSVGPSPEWLRMRLESVGQRSINTIVDLTNFIMLDTGQPLHAFDADKVQGSIIVRRAKEGEELILLDGSKITPTSSMLVIADEEGPLALAGIKGGKRAEITSETKNVIFEAANFEGSQVRRTSQAVGIRNDSSKRFENEVTPERAELALLLLSEFTSREFPDAKFGQIVDIYAMPVMPRSFVVRMNDISTALGCDIPRAVAMDILKRCCIDYYEDAADENVLTLTVPLYRSDLVAIEDIVDEVGRIYGYEHVKGKVPEQVENRPINKNFYYFNLIRKTLLEQGFFEIYTHTLTEKGDMQLENPLNAERGYLRNDLSESLIEKLALNLKFGDLLGFSSIKLFEIGNVFAGKKERTSLAFGVLGASNKKGEAEQKEALAKASGSLSEVLQISPEEMKNFSSIKDECIEIDIGKVIEKLETPHEDIDMPPLPETLYTPVSPYPFMVRDIAVFVPGETREEKEVLSIITKHGTDLLVRTALFDVFTKKKEGEPVRTSYAYRLVFQAKDRTLTDDEINIIMKDITDDMNSKDGWQVR